MRVQSCVVYCTGFIFCQPENILVSRAMLTVSPAGSPALSTKVTVEASTSVPPMLLAFVKLSEGVQILCAINVNKGYRIPSRNTKSLYQA